MHRWQVGGVGGLFAPHTSCGPKTILPSILCFVRSFLSELNGRRKGLLLAMLRPVYPECFFWSGGVP